MKAINHQDSAWEAWRPGVETRMLISAVNGSAQLCMFEQRIAPGAGAPAHRHPVEEVLTVREGEAEMWIEGARMTLSAGQSLIVPAGRLHGFHNSGSGALHVHAALASPIFEAFPEGATEPVRRWTYQHDGGAMPDRDSMIRGLFKAYLANDRAAVEDALAEDFRFTSPYDDALDKAAYFERCWKTSDWIERHEIERIFVQGNEAFVTYQCVTKDGKSFRNTAYFVFAGDKVGSIDVYFGAAYENSVFVSQPR
jgi:quercetin dioxygenase-like cupin family protein/ketosteroid isomerase-like protein